MKKATFQKTKADQLIMALLEQPSVEKAAASLGISDATAYRWLQRPEFHEKFLQARRGAFSRSMARLQHAATAAATTLLRVLVDPSTPPASRVRAADCILNHAALSFEREDLEMRLLRLELANGTD